MRMESASVKDEVANVARAGWEVDAEKWGGGVGDELHGEGGAERSGGEGIGDAGGVGKAGAKGGEGSGEAELQHLVGGEDVCMAGEDGSGDEDGGSWAVLGVGCEGCGRQEGWQERDPGER